jgi:hypothetical protein
VRATAALLALLLACGLRRHEAVALTLDHLQQHEEHWAIVDLVAKQATSEQFLFQIGSNGSWPSGSWQLQSTEENCSAEALVANESINQHFKSAAENFCRW